MMKIGDLINTCIHNLFRHKSRTLLTILGVIVGCCSVVIMISFGIGMKISQDNMLAQMGDLQVITVYQSGNGNSKITDKTIAAIEEMPNVIGVNPKISLDDIAASVSTADDNSRYKAEGMYISGMKKENIALFGYEIVDGKGFGSSEGDTIEALAGRYFAYLLADSQRPQGANTIDYWSYLYDENGEENEDNLPKPYVDVLNTPLYLTLGETSAESTTKNVVQKIKIVGILKEDYTKGMETSDGIIIKSEDLKKLQKEYYQLNNIPSKTVSYSEAAVKVNDIKNVAEAEKKIKSLNCSTSSMESIREPMEKEVRQKQLMFAGLGVVSLFVAALGIMNTMIMAISERKREIGVMKALGCFVKDIKAMFLMEAGIIGLVGGAAGLIVSLLVSAIINIVSAADTITDMSALVQTLFNSTDRVSVVTWQLGLGAVVFSAIVGIASGYYPASSAVKISALDAIRAQ